MISETIGSGGDHSSIALWETSVNNTDDETGTCIQSADLGGGSNIAFNASNTGSWTYLLTANSSNEVNAPTYTAMTTKARSSNRFLPSTTGWVFERIGYTFTSDVLIQADLCVVRRMVLASRVRPFSGMSGTITVSNCAFLNTTGIYNGVSGVTVNIYHSTCFFSGGGTMFLLDGGTALNCYAVVAQGTATCFGGGAGGDFNVSQDTTAPGSSSTKYARSESGWLTTTTAGSEDFSLVAGKQGWWAANKDAISHSGWPADVATDIVGTSRSSSIDPGIWQTPAGAPAGHPAARRLPNRVFRPVEVGRSGVEVY